MIDKQEHYTKLKIEPIDIMLADFTKEELAGFYKGNILKYVLRGKGQEVKDAQKIQVYASWLEQLYKENENESN